MSKFYKGTEVQCGEHKAIVTSVEVINNQFYKSDEPESGWNSPHQYNIGFRLESGQEFKQNFVRPDEDSLFGQLYAMNGNEFSEEVDEQSIVGTECVVEIVLNKKGYKTIYNAWPIGSSKENPNATEEEKEVVEKKTENKE